VFQPFDQPTFMTCLKSKLIGSLRIPSLAFAVACLQGCSTTTAAPIGLQAQKPNVVVFLVDDLGWQDLSLALHSSVTPFNKRYRTPHVERLAARGMTFTQAYASAPVCTPTRTSLLTGSSPARNHITYWILRENQDTSAPWPGLLPPDWNVNGLQPGSVTLPELLKESGYRTLHVGKAHLGAVMTAGADPRALGFDVNIAGHGAGAPASYLGTESFARDSVWDVPGLEAWHDKDVFLTEALAAEACEAIRQCVEDDVPFFLHMAPYAVHTPITTNERYLGHYADLPAREAAYASMIETVDAALGALLEQLDELGVTENTLVVFTSDNGGLSAHGRDGDPHTHNAPLRSGKGSAYEGGIRVPAVIAWPGHIAPGSRSDVPIITHDIFPTVLAATGTKVPESHIPNMDGRDLTLLLEGGQAPTPTELLWHQPHYWGVSGPGIEPFSALRSGDWKLIHWHANGSMQLYNLAIDPGESQDLALEHPDVVNRLANRLGESLRDAGAQRSRNETTLEPIPWPGTS
jgi:arylsulfatase A-like enzyme